MVVAWLLWRRPLHAACFKLSDPYFGPLRFCRPLQSYHLIPALRSLNSRCSKCRVIIPKSKTSSFWSQVHTGQRLAWQTTLIRPLWYVLCTGVERGNVIKIDAQIPLCRTSIHPRIYYSYSITLLICPFVCPENTFHRRNIKVSTHRRKCVRTAKPQC